jgi:hypothetical protein
MDIRTDKIRRLRVDLARLNEGSVPRLIASLKPSLDPISGNPRCTIDDATCVNVSRSRGLARGLPKVLGQVRLVPEAAPKRNVTQGLIGRQHVLSCQFHATSHDESVRWLP